MGGGSGSPIVARTQVNLLLVIAILVSIIVVIVIIYLISKAIRDYHNSPAYFEKKRLRPTSSGDISEIARQCKLVRDERDVLQQICHKTPSPNILYTVHDLEAMEKLFKKEFDDLDQKGDENSKTFLFSLRSKIRKNYMPPEEMTSSRKIDIGTRMTYTVSRGIHHKLTYVNKTQDVMILNLPQFMVERNEKPATLSRILLVFELASGSPYQMETRVVRYQLGSHGEEQMIVMHSDQIIPLQKRQVERIEMQEDCDFSSVIVTTVKEGKNSHIEYKMSSTIHKGILLDVSAGGCRLVVNIPIKAEQFINISGRLNTRDVDSAIGTILRTTKREDGKFILHIKFVKIDPPTVNRIQAKACGYA